MNITTAMALAVLLLLACAVTPKEEHTLPSNGGDVSGADMSVIGEKPDAGAVAPLPSVRHSVGRPPNSRAYPQ